MENNGSLSTEDQGIVKRIIIKLNIYAGFMELAGAEVKNVNVNEIFKQAQEELQREGIEGERASRILMAVGEQM